MNIKKTFFTLALFSSAVTANVMAADIEASVVKNVTEVTEPAFSDFLATNPLKIFAPSSFKANKKRGKYSSEQISPLAAATGITYFEIAAVGSSNVGWEYPQSYLQSTIEDHGGSILYVAVLQLGLGNNNGSNMNGLSKSPFQTDRLCGSDSHYPCVSGETITGFIYYFNYSGQQTGFFTASANSVASPFGFWSDSISIR